MKQAFLFPGQGAQFVGMGSEAVQCSDVAREIFARGDKVLGFDISRICFEGPAEELNRTEICQPAVFLTSAAMFEAMKAEGDGMSAKSVGGLSLGEYTALYAAGLVDFEDGLILTSKRGKAMQEASEQQAGGMVGIIGLDAGRVGEICDESGEGEVLEAVNFNCPGQIVVSGSKGACERAEKLADKYGAIKTIRLDVAGAFHTEMMRPAAEILSAALAKCDIKEPGDVKVIANVNAEYYQSSGQIKEGLVQQLISPVFWQRCMERLLADGFEEFYEIGPGRVLTGLMKRINRKIKVRKVKESLKSN